MADDTGPVRLRLLVTPPEAAVGTPTAVEVALRNPGPGTVTVNARMLVTPDRSGEIGFRPEGPSGYRNEAGFRVRAGEPEAGDFVDLPPGAEVARSWPLDPYVSLQLPGRYRLTATYRNRVARSPDGRPAVVTELSASTTFHRSEPPPAGLPAREEP
jgi:hypothetical protein